MKTFLLATVLLASAGPLTSPALAADPLDTAVRRQLAAGGPWIAPAEDRFIRARCGLAAAGPLRNVDIDGDVLSCPDGRRVRDPQVRVIGRDVSQRANARARAVLDSPEVKAAMARTIHERTEAARKAARPR